MSAEKSDIFIAGDWGTSQLRLFLCKRGENSDISILDKITGPGVTGCAGKLEETLLSLIENWARDYGKLSIVLSGMVGSNIGWVETPYIECPANIGDIIAGRVNLIADGHKVSIIPGLCCQNPLDFPDVMRGEEMQIIGWLMSEKKHQQGSYLMCLPGTHTKWVLVQDGSIVTFWTSVTGELFSLLNSHSVLVAKRETEINTQIFLAGVKEAEKMGAENLLSGLFGVRSRQIRAGLPAADAASFLSGNLIATDIVSATKLIKKLSPDISTVILIGEAKISNLFSLAINHFGLESEIMHATDIFLAGLRMEYE